MRARTLLPSLFLLVACAHGRDPRYAAATALSHGCGGGIAGTCSGTTAFRDGRIERWVESATAAEDVRRDRLQVEPSRVEPLFATAERIGLLDLPRGEPSNWCCSLTLVSPAETFTLHYEGDPPEVLRPLLESIEALPGP